MNSFDVYFLGKIMRGHELQDVKDKIGKRFKVTDRKLEYMFSGNPVRVKTAVDVERAGKFREIFREAGALVEIVPTGQKVAAPAGKAKPVQHATRATPAATSGGSNPEQPKESAEAALLPPRTGSLIDCAPKVEAVPLPDISGLDVSPPGEPLAEDAPPPEFDVDISHLQALPANTGSLEEFTRDLPELTIPDTSHLEAQEADGRNLVEDLPQTPAQPLPDISYLEEGLVNTDPFQDSGDGSEPETVTDLSELRLKD